jgi:hypothetical protein
MTTIEAGSTKMSIRQEGRLCVVAASARPACCLVMLEWDHPDLECERAGAAQA